MANHAPDITSTSNHMFKRWKSLLGSKGIRKYGETLVSGKKIVHEFTARFPEQVVYWILSPKTRTYSEDLINGSQHPGKVIDEVLFRELDIFGTGYPLLVVKIPEILNMNDAIDSPPMTLYLPFQDPSNIGAVTRSAVAFGVQRLVLLKEAANPFHPKSIRASAGAVFSTQFIEGPTITALSAETIPLIGLAADGEPISTFRFPSQLGLLPGVEGPGLNGVNGLSDTIAIPMCGQVESLNAVVATSIVLFEWSKQLDKRHS